MIIVLLVLSINRYSSQIPVLSPAKIRSVPVGEQISEALTKAQRFPSAHNLGTLGMVYHSSANYEQAARCYDLAIQRDKSEWIWNYYLGFLNKEMGKSDAVIENYNLVIEKNPGINLAWYYLGEAYRNTGKNELAEKSFLEISDLSSPSAAGKNATRYDYFPLGTYAGYQLARLYMATDSIVQAEKILTDIIQKNRSFGPAYRLLSNIYRVNGNTEQGERFRIRANDLVVFTPPVDTLIDRLVLLSRSESYLLKKIDDAEKSIYPEWAMKLVNIAMQYFPENKYLVSKAIKIYLDDQAVAYVDQHISYFKDNFTELYNTGILFFQKRLYPQAMNYLTRALDLKSQDVEIQNCLAICYWSMGDRQKANEILNSLIDTYSDNPNVLAEITNLLYDLGEDEKAGVYLKRLQRVSPGNPKVEKMSGTIAEKEGRFREAIALYESSFKNDPEDMTTIRYLLNLLFKQKMWDQYISHIRTALEHHPNDPYLLERLGTILVTCPDPAWRETIEGRDYSERAFIHTSSRSLTLVFSGRSLALAYAELGDKQNATTVINMTMNIARRENISESYLRDLENISRRIQTLSNQ
jgi:tetratricopeptide (TPR) repeat protein